VQIANLKGDNANLETEVTKLNNQVVTANNKITTLETRVSNYQTQITNLRNSNTQLNNRVQTLTSEKYNLQDELNMATSELEMMNMELEILRQDNENNYIQIQELEQNIILKENQVTELQDSIMQYENTISDLQMEVDDKEVEIMMLENEKSEIESEILMLNNEIQGLNDEISNLNNEILTNNEEITELNNTISTKNDEISDLEIQLQTSTNTIDSLNAEISTLQENINELNEKIDYYENALENYIIVDYNVSSESNYMIQDKDSGILAENPVKDGYIFKGWSLTENGSIINTTTTFSEDTTLFAVFQKYPVADDFYYKRKLPNGDWVYTDATGTNAYDGVWYKKASESTIKQIHSGQYIWEVREVIDDNRIVVSTYSNGYKGTIVYDSSIDKTIVVDDAMGYGYAHCMKDNVLLLSNGSTNTLFDLTAETLISKVSNYNYTLDTFLDLPSGDCLLGGDSFSSRLYIYRTDTHKIGELYVGGQRWKLMELFDSGVALAGNGSLAGIVKYDDNTKQVKLIGSDVISSVSGIEIINSKYALILSSGVYYRYCLDDDSLVEVDSDTNAQFLLALSISENEIVFTGKQNYCGVYFYNAEENTLRTLYNPNNDFAVYEYYRIYDNGNILFYNWSETYRVVYIASTKTAEVYKSSIDYNTYTGANNE